MNNFNRNINYLPPPINANQLNQLINQQNQQQAAAAVANLSPILNPGISLSPDFNNQVPILNNPGYNYYMPMATGYDNNVVQMSPNYSLNSMVSSCSQAHPAHSPQHFVQQSQMQRRKSALQIVDPSTHSEIDLAEIASKSHRSEVKPNVNIRPNPLKTNHSLWGEIKASDVAASLKTIEPVSIESVQQSTEDLSAPDDLSNNTANNFSKSQVETIAENLKHKVIVPTFIQEDLVVNTTKECNLVERSINPPCNYENGNAETESVKVPTLPNSTVTEVDSVKVERIKIIENPIETDAFDEDDDFKEVVSKKKKKQKAQEIVKPEIKSEFKKPIDRTKDFNNKRRKAGTNQQRQAEKQSRNDSKPRSKDQSEIERNNAQKKDQPRFNDCEKQKSTGNDHQEFVESAYPETNRKPNYHDNRIVRENTNRPRRNFESSEYQTNVQRHQEQSQTLPNPKTRKFDEAQNRNYTRNGPVVDGYFEESNKNPIKSRQPSGDKFRQPSGDKFRQPSGDNFRQPSGDKFRQPSGDKFRQPSGDNFRQPSGDKFRQPSGDKFRQPSGDNFRQPSGDKFRQPSGDKFRQPSGDKIRQPSGDNFRQPSGDKFRQPSGDKFRQPSGDNFNKNRNNQRLPSNNPHQIADVSTSRRGSFTQQNVEGGNFHDFKMNADTRRTSTIQNNSTVRNQNTNKDNRNDVRGENADTEYVWTKPTNVRASRNQHLSHFAENQRDTRRDNVSFSDEKPRNNNRRPDQSNSNTKKVTQKPFNNNQKDQRNDDRELANNYNNRSHCNSPQGFDKNHLVECQQETKQDVRASVWGGKGNNGVTRDQSIQNNNKTSVWDSQRIHNSNSAEQKQSNDSRKAYRISKDAPKNFSDNQEAPVEDEEKSEEIVSLQINTTVVEDNFRRVLYASKSDNQTPDKSKNDGRPLDEDHTKPKMVSIKEPLTQGIPNIRRAYRRNKPTEVSVEEKEDKPAIISIEKTIRVENIEAKVSCEDVSKSTTVINDIKHIPSSEAVYTPVDKTIVVEIVAVVKESQTEEVIVEDIKTKLPEPRKTAKKANIYSRNDLLRLRGQQRINLALLKNPDIAEYISEESRELVFLRPITNEMSWRTELHRQDNSRQPMDVDGGTWLRGRVPVVERLSVPHAEYGYVTPRMRNDAEVDESVLLKKKLIVILNRMTPENFGSCQEELMDIVAVSEESMNILVNEIFKKAIKEESYCTTYAKFCAHVSESKVENSALFRAKLLDKCKTMFDKPLDEHIEETKVFWTQKIEEQIHDALKNLIDIDEQVQFIKDRFIGNIRFISELFLQNQLIYKAVRFCIESMLGSIKEPPTEESLQGACVFMYHCGRKLEAYVTLNPTQRQGLSDIMTRIRQLAVDNDISQRVRFKIKDILDMHSRGWELRLIQKTIAVTPKTLNEVKEEMLDAKKELDKKNNQASGGVGKYGSMHQGHQRQYHHNQNRQHVNPQRTQTMMATRNVVASNLKLTSKDLNDTTTPLMPNFRKWSQGCTAVKTTKDPLVPVAVEIATVQPVEKVVPIEIEQDDEIIAEEIIELLKEGGSPIKKWSKITDKKKIIEDWLNTMLERKMQFRSMLGDYLYNLIQAELLTTAELIDGANELVECFEDLVTDIPKLWKFLAEFLERFVQTDSVGIEQSFFSTFLGSKSEVEVDEADITLCLQFVRTAVAKRLGDNEAAKLVFQ